MRPKILHYISNEKRIKSYDFLSFLGLLYKKEDSGKFINLEDIFSKESSFIDTFNKLPISIKDKYQTYLVDKISDILDKVMKNIQHDIQINNVNDILLKYGNYININLEEQFSIYFDNLLNNKPAYIDINCNIPIGTKELNFTIRFDSGEIVLKRLDVLKEKYTTLLYSNNKFIRDFIDSLLYVDSLTEDGADIDWDKLDKYDLIDLLVISNIRNLLITDMSLAVEKDFDNLLDNFF